MPWLRDSLSVAVCHTETAALHPWDIRSFCLYAGYLVASNYFLAIIEGHVLYVPIHGQGCILPKIVGMVQRAAPALVESVKSR